MLFFRSKHADSIFEDNLKLNPYYPFKKIESQDLKTPGEFTLFIQPYRTHHHMQWNPLRSLYKSMI